MAQQALSRGRWTEGTLLRILEYVQGSRRQESAVGILDPTATIVSKYVVFVELGDLICVLVSRH
jgi:hypothetical protein